MLFRKWLLLMRNVAVGLIAATAIAGGTWAAATHLRNDSSAQDGSPCHEQPASGGENQNCNPDPGSCPKIE
jgi:hypothetical protein